MSDYTYDYLWLFVYSLLLLYFSVFLRVSADARVEIEKNSIKKERYGTSKGLHSYPSPTGHWNCASFRSRS